MKARQKAPDLTETPRYTAAEAARLLGMHASTIRRWLDLSDGGGLVVRDRSGEKLASFLDLVEMFIAAELVNKQKLKFGALRNWLREASERVGVGHPLARQKFLVESDRLWLDLDDALVHLGEAGQLGLQQVVRARAESVEFDRSGIASKWWPAGHEAGVVVDPARAFGEPTLSNTRVPIEAVVDLWTAEGERNDVVAKAFGLTEKQVHDAVSFHRRRMAA